jgi:hypothetical protein
LQGIVCGQGQEGQSQASAPRRQHRDCGATWAYVSPAGAAIQLSSMVWNAGDTITIQAGRTLTHAA